jgi:hypothetical protein
MSPLVEILKRQLCSVVIAYRKDPGELTFKNLILHITLHCTLRNTFTFHIVHYIYISIPCSDCICYIYSVPLRAADWADEADTTVFVVLRIICVVHHTY